MYNNPESSRIVREQVEAVLYDGMYDLPDRAASLIRLLTIIEQVLEADGDIEELIFEATMHAYPHTEHCDSSLTAFIDQVRRETKRELMKAEKSER
jgi:hypothetical protein